MNNSKFGRDARRALTNEQRQEFSALICQKAQEFIKENDIIMLYNAFDGEVNVDKIRAKTIILPTIRNEKIVPVKKCDNTTIGKYNIYEPIGEEYTDKIDVFIVPMCAFDKKLIRAGFGKGYYDKFLADKKGLKIGVAFSCQEVEQIFKKSTDVCMDMIITEKEIIK